VYRGVAAYCTACGAPRLPLTATSVNLAGQPSQVTGQVTRVFGWIVLAGGLSVAVMVLGLMLAIFPGVLGATLFAAPIAAASIGAGVWLLRSGRTLESAGKGTEHRTKAQAIFALAQNRGGVVTAFDVAAALAIPPAQADAILTDLAKASPDHVAVDIDERSGTVLYRVDPAGQVRMRIFDDRVRVAPPAPAREAVTVDATEEEARPRHAAR
jgi:hypothetical protein